MGVSRTKDNNLLVGFEILYREAAGKALMRLFSPLRASKNGLCVVPSEDCYPAEFFNHYEPNEFSNPRVTDCKEHKVIRVPLVKSRIEKFEEALRRQAGRVIKCTPSRKDGEIQRYDSEGMALSELHDNPYIFGHLLSQVRERNPSSVIEGCIVKFYSSWDICSSCQEVLLASRNLLEQSFNKVVNDTPIDQIHIQIPLFIVGVTNLPYDSDCHLYYDTKKRECVRCTTTEGAYFNGAIRIKVGVPVPFIFIRGGLDR